MRVPPALHRCALALAAIALPASPAPANAQVTLYENGDPATVNGSFNSWSNAWAMDFVLGGSAQVDAVDVFFLGLTDPSTGPGLVTWEVLANAGGAPGSLLAGGAGSAVFTGTGPFSDGWRLDMGGLALSSGVYWLVLTNSAPDANLRGNFNHGDVGFLTYSEVTADGYDRSDFASYSAEREPYFKLVGRAVVPEPATIFLLGAGLVGVAFVARRRHGSALT